MALAAVLETDQDLSYCASSESRPRRSANPRCGDLTRRETGPVDIGPGDMASGYSESGGGRPGAAGNDASSGSTDPRVGPLVPGPHTWKPFRESKRM